VVCRGGTHLLALVCSSSAALAVVREGEIEQHKVRESSQGPGRGVIRASPSYKEQSVWGLLCSCPVLLSCTVLC